MPKISICVPVYNVERYIGRCLESMQRQSLSDIEIIVVNDHTPDKSMSIVKKYAEKDYRIRIIDHDKNHGQMVARHTGYMAAKGDFIIFCDSDDTLPDDALESLYNKAVKSDADIVSGVIEYIPVKGERYRWKNSLSYGSDKISVFRSLLTDEFGHNLCSRLFRRELLQDYDYETYEKATTGEDAMLFYQVVDNVSKVVTIDKVVYEYWQNLESSSQVRLKDNALKSIAQLNIIRVQTAGQYSELQKLLGKKISSVYWSLKSQGYDVGKYFHVIGLGIFCSLSDFIIYQGLMVTLKMLAKLLVYKLRI